MKDIKIESGLMDSMIGVAQKTLKFLRPFVIARLGFTDLLIYNRFLRVLDNLRKAKK